MVRFNGQAAVWVSQSEPHQAIPSRCGPRSLQGRAGRDDAERWGHRGVHVMVGATLLQAQAAEDRLRQYLIMTSEPPEKMQAELDRSHLKDTCGILVNRFKTQFPADASTIADLEKLKQERNGLAHPLE